ncbi:segregation and condensation protein B [Pseudoxanthomonas sp. GM95]|nr:segregation and condensation protein B [Pseudoxanthomonas sp. GM95]
MQDEAFDHESDSSAPAAVDQGLINRIVEGALLAANLPMTTAQLEGLFPEGHPPPEGAIATALEQLSAACAERGVELVEVASGWRYQVKAEVHGWVSRMWTERKTRYTRATLETLALIAYRQPITRGEIEQVRGVAVSSNIIQALEEREWIRVVGHRDVPGRPALFGTTRGFLDYFGLKRLDELPPLSELKDIGELDPQLPFASAPIAAKADAEGQPASDNAGSDAADDTADADASNETPAQDVQADDGDDAAESAAQDTAPADTDAPDDDAAAADDIAPTATHAEPGDEADDTQTSQQPQEDDAEAVSSEQKP